MVHRRERKSAEESKVISNICTWFRHGLCKLQAVRTNLCANSPVVNPVEVFGVKFFLCTIRLGVHRNICSEGNCGIDSESVKSVKSGRERLKVEKFSTSYKCKEKMLDYVGVLINFLHKSDCTAIFQVIILFTY